MAALNEVAVSDFTTAVAQIFIAKLFSLLLNY